MPWADAALYAG